jgi:hypothetical protein
LSVGPLKQLESNWVEGNFSIKKNPQLEYNYSDVGEKKITILNKKCRLRVTLLKEEHCKKNLRFRCYFTEYEIKCNHLN